MNKKVLLKLYAEFNLGDDLFLKIILERYPKVLFYLDAPKDYREAFSSYNNLIVYESKKLSFIDRCLNLVARKLVPKQYHKRLTKRILRENELYFNKCDYFVSIGGSIFMQPNISPFYYDIVYYNLVNSYFETKGVFFIGCNFGPYISESYRDSYREIFSKAKDVCFREEYSYNLFHEVRSVRWHPDVVFSMTYQEVPKTNSSVGFSIISPRDSVNSDAYIKKYAELITYYLKNEFQVTLFSFCKKEGDEIWIDKISNLICDNLRPKINIIFYNGDIEVFLGEYSKIEIMYCSRFHSMILSMLYNQKIYPVAYSRKMINVLEDMGYIGNVLELSSFQDQNVIELFNGVNNNVYDAKSFISEGYKQFSVLDSYLN